MREEFDEEMNSWFPVIDKESEERQYRERTEDYYFSGGNVDQELAALSKRIDEIVNENPGLVREKISLSQCTQPVPYESWEEAVVVISYYTPETDYEYRKRLSSKVEEREAVKEDIKRKMKKYPYLMDEILNEKLKEDLGPELVAKSKNKK